VFLLLQCISCREEGGYPQSYLPCHLRADSQQCDVLLLLQCNSCREDGGCTPCYLPGYPRAESQQCDVLLLLQCISCREEGLPLVEILAHSTSSSFFMKHPSSACQIEDTHLKKKVWPSGTFNP